VIFLALAVTARAPAESAPEAAGGPRVVAITIDDLPLAGEGWTGNDLSTVRSINARMVKALRAHGATAIGFVTERDLHVPGEMDARVAILRGWLEAGLELGNHTFSHFGLQKTPLREYEDDVLHGEVITGRLLAERGREMRYFRYPFNQTGPDAETKNAFLEFLEIRGYRVAPFTVEHGDYIFDRVYGDALREKDDDLAARVRTAYLEHLDVAFAYAESLSLDTFGREIPQVLLIHVNRINGDCLGQMLDRIQERGYRVVSLDAALEDPAYRTEDAYVGPWGISWLHRWRVGLGMPRRVDEPDPPPFVLERYRELTSPSR
jgi:peptidoglycan/xylan/chitin deacetylase (PgdA/CDA1 family)